MKRVAILAIGAAIGVGAAFGVAGCGDDETSTVTDEVTGAVETAAEEKLETTSSSTSSSTTSTDAACGGDAAPCDPSAGGVDSGKWPGIDDLRFTFARP